MYHRVSNRVWLLMKNIATQDSYKKLRWLVYSYKVIEHIGTYTYYLDTPSRIYNIFYISLLQSQSANLLPLQVVNKTQPLVIKINSNNKQEIKAVLVHYIHKRCQEVYVKQIGYTQLTQELVVSLYKTFVLVTYKVITFTSRQVLQVRTTY